MAVASSLKKRANLLGLLPAVFNQQPSLLGQVALGIFYNVADVLEAICTAHQGLQRFMMERRQMRVVGLDVGRVGDNDIKLTAHSAKPVAF